jgi:hypothetical protein
VISPTVIILLLVGAFIFLRGGTASAITTLPSTAGVNPNDAATTNALATLLNNAIAGLSKAAQAAGGGKSSGGGGAPSGGGSSGAGSSSTGTDDSSANADTTADILADAADGDASIAATDTNADTSGLGDVGGTQPAPPFDMSTISSPTFDPSGSNDSTSSGDDEDFFSDLGDEISSGSFSDDSGGGDFSGGDDSSFDDEEDDDFEDF